jgi:hypothetical protein
VSWRKTCWCIDLKGGIERGLLYACKPKGTLVNLKYMTNRKLRNAASSLMSCLIVPLTTGPCSVSQKPVEECVYNDNIHLNVTTANVVDQSTSAGAVSAMAA